MSDTKQEKPIKDKKEMTPPKELVADINPDQILKQPREQYIFPKVGEMVHVYSESRVDVGLEESPNNFCPAVVTTILADGRIHATVFRDGMKPNYQRYIPPKDAVEYNEKHYVMM